MTATEVITRMADLAPVRARWLELAAKDDRDGFFRTPHWYDAWMKHIRPDAEPHVVVVRSGGDIVGIAPLCRLRFRDLGFRLSALCFAGRETVSGDFLDFPAEPGLRREVASAVLRALWEGTHNWSLLLAGELVDGGALRAEMTSLCSEKRTGVRTQEERICPYIALPGSFDAYLSTLSSSTRYHIRRRTRDVLQTHGATVTAYEGLHVHDHLDTLARLHRARWDKDGQTGTLGRTGFADFLSDIASTARTRLYVMRAGEEPVAALLMFYFERAALYYQAGWAPDSAVSRHSPGVVLMARSIQDAIAEGFAYYEFLRGDEAYKSRWTSTFRTTATLLCARGFAARQYLNVCRLKDAIKRRLANTAGTADGQPGVLREQDQCENTS